MDNEYVYSTLADIHKKIEGLKGFHLPVILQTLDNYRQAEVDQCFIDLEEAKLKKVYTQIEELEQKAERLFRRLHFDT